ncbi:LuxR C-terminal-related transcriptional regulator [Nocardia sp. CA-128927]|uniref:response regulator transcription factor n=1 Tax=Nocardia sp. CA-128927 TaxID=3239975 RepID=UPI003D99CD08
MGLRQTLTAAGIQVVAVRTSPDEDPSWLADAALIDAAAIPHAQDLATITEAAKSTAVLVLNNEAANDDEVYLEAGAAGVISKSAPGESIVRAVRIVTAGTPVRTAAAPPLVRQRTRTTGRRLSGREEQVLRQIAHGLTHGQVAARLGISPHTVDTYVRRIRSKLGVGNKAELTRAALLGQLVSQTEDDDMDAPPGLDAQTAGPLESPALAAIWPTDPLAD